MSQATLFDVERPGTRAGIVPRAYQVQAHDACLAEWEKGQPGALIRLATGLGKTLTACLIADTWLRRGDDYRAMVISYERQLVHQFAEEIEDYLGIHPGIEMEAEKAAASDRFVVASRATLLPSTPPTKAQAEELATFGIKPMDVVSAKLAKRYLTHLRKGGDRDVIIDDIITRNLDPLIVGGVYSRLHKFDHRLNWMVIWDEAHKHAYKLPSVGHIVDWFGQNPLHRRIGLTATPKRADGVSIGDVMFPAVAIDYPLFSRSKPCAVLDGWAVPYVQKYIEVEGVDFKSLARVSKDANADFDPAALEATLGDEQTLAKLCNPMLDLVGERRTLIFSPGVQMAKDVARFINARSPCKCSCGKEKWYAKSLIGDGAECACGLPITQESVTREGDLAEEVDGATPDEDRKNTYKRHKGGLIQFLSVCSTCREGYNDPDISAIAIFRPVSKAASSLAEQMKGRGCRVCKGISRLLHSLPDAEARLKAIQESYKSNCLVIDLVGITGLADCATTVEIYADGEADEIKDRANAILLEGDTDDVDEAVEQAKAEAEATKERIRAERQAAEERAREEFERRSRAQAETKYTTHDVGYGSQIDPLAATEKQLNYIANLGMTLNVTRSKVQAGRIITQLKARVPVEEVARLNGLQPDQWYKAGPSLAQCSLMRREGIPVERARTKYDASLLIDAKKSPSEFVVKRMEAMASVRSGEELTAVAKDIALVKGVLPQAEYEKLIEMGRRKRASMTQGEEPIPD